MTVPSYPFALAVINLTVLALRRLQLSDYGTDSPPSTLRSQRAQMGVSAQSLPGSRPRPRHSRRRPCRSGFHSGFVSGGLGADWSHAAVFMVHEFNQRWQRTPPPPPSILGFNAFLKAHTAEVVRASLLALSSLPAK